MRQIVGSKIGLICTFFWVFLIIFFTHTTQSKPLLRQGARSPERTSRSRKGFSHKVIVVAVLEHQSYQEIPRVVRQASNQLKQSRGASVTCPPYVLVASDLSTRRSTSSSVSNPVISFHLNLSPTIVSWVFFVFQPQKFRLESTATMPFSIRCHPDRRISVMKARHPPNIPSS